MIEAVAFFIGLMLPGLVLGALVCAAVWARFGSTRPGLAGSICFLLGWFPLGALVLLGLQPFDASGFGLIWAAIAAGPFVLGVVALGIGAARSARGSAASLRKLLRDVYEDSHRQS